MRRLLRIALAGLVVALLLPAAADASNRRISISNYSWSDPEIELNLGEHVTWYWTGPDLMHSVTGQPPAAAGLDSDPQTNQPKHDIGDQFQIAFDKPGTYVLQCKLHSTVRGTVTVSATPGDPAGEPDPVPKSNVDRTPPRLRDPALRQKRFGRNGTAFTFSLGERSRVAVDFYRYDSEGRRRYAGYRVYNGYVGFNGVRFAKRSKNFRPRPGRYGAVIEATDNANNSSNTRTLGFRIRKR